MFAILDTTADFSSQIDALSQVEKIFIYRNQIEMIELKATPSQHKIEQKKNILRRSLTVDQKSFVVNKKSLLQSKLKCQLNIF